MYSPSEGPEETENMESKSGKMIALDRYGLHSGSPEALCFPCSSEGQSAWQQTQIIAFTYH